MKTILVLLTILSAGGPESHTYSFKLPADCEPGAYVSVASMDDYLALGMQCVVGPEGKGVWRPARRKRKGTTGPGNPGSRRNGRSRIRGGGKGQTDGPRPGGPAKPGRRVAS